MNESQNIMLNERNQTQMSVYCMIPFIWNPNTGKMNTLWEKSESCGEYKLPKRCRELSEGDGNFTYLILGGNYISVCNCQYSSNLS